MKSNFHTSHIWPIHTLHLRVFRYAGCLISSPIWAINLNLKSVHKIVSKPNSTVETQRSTQSKVFIFDFQFNYPVKVMKYFINSFFNSSKHKKHKNKEMNSFFVKLPFLKKHILIFHKYFSYKYFGYFSYYDYIYIYISSCYDSMPLTLGLIGGWWFQHSVPWLQVCLSVEGATNVSWPWLSPLWGWGSLTIAFTSKFVYMAQHFNLLQLNPFDLRADREGWWFEHSVS